MHIYIYIYIYYVVFVKQYKHITYIVTHVTDE